MTVTLAPAQEGLATLLADAGAFDAETPGPGFLTRLRREGLECFGRLGLPTTRQEDWRSTNVAALGRTPLRVASSWPDAGASSRQSLSGSIAAESFLGRTGAHRDHPFVALSTAFLSEGVVVHVRDRTIEREPFEIRFDGAGAGAMTHPRVLIVLEEGAEATVVERYCSGSEASLSLTNAVTEVFLGPGARLDHTRVVDEGADAWHVGAVHARLGRDARLTSRVFTLGGKLVRNEVHAHLDGEGSEVSLDGLYVVSRGQHVDNHTVIVHAAPHTTSHELYKGLIGPSARGIFDGKIVVQKNAQKTSAEQSNRNLLLGDDASADSKPQLEIENNDVKCTHGSTTGRLDANALFYLRSRGLSEQDAKGLLLHAFGAELIDRVPVAALRDELGRRLHSWLPESAT